MAEQPADRDAVVVELGRGQGPAREIGRNRGVEIESGIADHKTRSLITEQVEMGVAVRMAVLDTLSRGHGRNEP